MEKEQTHREPLIIACQCSEALWNKSWITNLALLIRRTFAGSDGHLRIVLVVANPVSFSANSNGLSVHIGKCSTVVRRSLQTSKEPAGTNLQIKEYSKELSKTPPKLAIHKR
ncbi:hypothetical protein AVEN_7025-1 [Araneus ventricosus]|uniref:Uncharacterized protein n=1 Tax=Araneus ventricosus TaxID=182803 RepID=A0A4Y2SRU0_ARAVE|nr:hypothetical protein AVEN_7025-1 [Araneus ventricosus]